MTRAFGWILKGLVVLVLLAAALWLVSRLSGATPEQEAALALMEQPGVQPGKDAFAALWLLRYDVPEAQLESVTEVDLKRFAQASPDADFRSSAQDRYADLAPSSADRGLLCSANEDCIARVRAAPEVYRALVARNRRLLDRIAALSGYGHDNNRMLALGPHAPFPEYELGRAAITEHALAFVDGHAGAALIGSCRDLRTWRTLGANSNSLIARMVSAAYTAAYVRQLAQMLAETSLETPLPPACNGVTTPMLDEGWLCPALRGEFAFSTGLLDVVQAESDGTGTLRSGWNRIVYDAGMTRANMAENLAHGCSPKSRLDASQDRRPPESLAPPSGLLRLECVSNAAGCILLDIGAPAYRDYQVRALDHAARMRLLDNVLWLRAQGATPATTPRLLAMRPDWLKGSRRDVEPVAGATRLRIALDRPGHGWEELPLAGSKMFAPR